MSNESLAYRRDVDGLRAIAVLSVALCHARLPGFSGGFVGVDVFFVISGYLITQIIVREIDRGSFSVLSFYERRVRRIFPALFAVLLVALAVGCWLLLPHDLVAMAKTEVATTLFAANFLFASQSGYFEPSAWSKPLLHTWSLAVEEQFYIVFPAMLLFAKKKLAGRYLALTWVAVVLSFALCAVGTANFRQLSFYLVPTRFWELGLGCLLALGAFPAPRSRSSREVAAALGLAGIAYAVATYTDNTKFPGFTTLPPCLGTTALLWAGSGGKSFVGRVLSTRPAVFVGLISYSLYLWHWPLLVFASYVVARMLSPAEGLGVVAVSIALAAASWKWIETPFRGSRSRVTREALFRGAISVPLATVAASIALVWTGGLPARLDAFGAEMLRIRVDGKKTFDWCQLERVAHGETWARSLGAGGEPASFVVWGDSHACMLAPGIDAQANRHGRAGLLATGMSCPPVLLDAKATRTRLCIDMNQRVMDAINTDPRLTDVVLVARWAMYFEETGYGPERIDLPYELNTDGGNSPAQVLGHSLRRTAAALTAHGKRVWIFGPVPEVGVDVPAVFARAHMQGRAVDPRPTFDIFLSRQRAVLDELETLRAPPLVNVLLPHEQTCRDGHCDVERDGVVLYFDANHLTPYGVDMVLSLLEPMFARGL